MVKKLVIKEAFNPRELGKYGFVRRPEDDFSDDGNRFRGYVYKNDKGEMPLTYLKADGEVYAAIALHHLNDLSYDEYKNLPSYRDADKYNGVPEDSVDVADLAKIAERLIDEYNEAKSKLDRVSNEELKDMCDKLEKAARDDYNKTIKMLDSISIVKILSLNEYKIKRLKDYLNSASRYVDNRYERMLSQSDRAKREFMKRATHDIEEYKNGENYWTKSLREIASEIK